MTPRCRIELKDKRLVKLLNGISKFFRLEDFIEATLKVNPEAHIKDTTFKVEYIDPYSDTPVVYSDGISFHSVPLDKVTYIKEVDPSEIASIPDREARGKGGIKWKSYFATTTQDVLQGSSFLKDSEVNKAQMDMLDLIEKGNHLAVLIQDGKDIAKDGNYVGEYGQVLVIVDKGKYQNGMTRAQVLRAAHRINKKVYAFSMHSGKEEDSFFNDSYSERVKINAEKTRRTRKEVDIQFKKQRDELNKLREEVKNTNKAIPLDILNVSSGNYRQNTKSLSDLEGSEVGSGYNIERIRVVTEGNIDKNPNFEVGDTIVKLNGTYFKIKPFQIKGVNERISSLYNKKVTKEDSAFLDFILKNQKVGQEYLYFKEVDGKYKFEYRPFKVPTVVEINSKEELDSVLSNPFRQTFNITVNMIQNYNEDIDSDVNQHLAYIPIKNGKYEVLDLVTFIKDNFVPDNIFYNRKTKDGLEIETRPVNRYFYFKPRANDAIPITEELPNLEEGENFETSC